MALSVRVDTALNMSGRYGILLSLGAAARAAVLSSDFKEPEVDYEYNYIGLGLRATGLVLCVMITGISVGFACWTKHYVKTQAVRASQPTFLWLICAGTFLMGAAIIPMSIDDEIATDGGCDIACQSIPYLFCVGFALVFSTFFSKTWRVNILFNKPTMQRMKVTAFDVSKPIFVILLSNILVIGLWTGLDPLVWVREEISPVESLGRCKSDGALPYVLTLVLLNLGALALTFYQAWHARKISIPFSESRYIVMAVACTLLASVVGIPVIIITPGQSRVHFYILSAIDFIMCTSLLVFTFVPKENFRRSNGRVKDSVLALMTSERSRTVRDIPRNSKQSVLLGLYQTDSGSICDALRSSAIHFDVKVLQNGNDILQHSREKKPAVIVLDQNLLGRTGFEVCEEIRSNMGIWGQQAILVVIASSHASDLRDASTAARHQHIADRLCLEDYIQGPFSPEYLVSLIEVSLLRMPLLWRRAPFSARESQRLAALQSTKLLDTEPEERFDRITRLCSTMFDVPISLVSLVDTDRQFFKSNVGLPGTNQTPRDHAFCAHTILNDGIMVVPDTLHDERFANNALVEGSPDIRFYAGCPIKVSSNEGTESIGTLCIIDSKPRDLREEELRALKDLGTLVEREVTLGT